MISKRDDMINNLRVKLRRTEVSLHKTENSLQSTERELEVMKELLIRTVQAEMNSLSFTINPRIAINNATNFVEKEIK